MKRIFGLLAVCHFWGWDPLHPAQVLTIGATATRAPVPHQDTTQHPTPYELFQLYQQGVEDWLQGNNRNGNGKETLGEALESISKFIPWLLSQPSLPPGLDPLVSLPPTAPDSLLRHRH